MNNSTSNWLQIAVFICAENQMIVSKRSKGTLGKDRQRPPVKKRTGDKGVVLTSFSYKRKTHYIIAKSGGFGDPDLLCRLAEQIGA